MQQAVKAQKNLIVQNQLSHQGLLEKMNPMSQIVYCHTCHQVKVQKDIKLSRLHRKTKARIWRWFQLFNHYSLSQVLEIILTQKPHCYFVVQYGHYQLLGWM
jgi:hypothetical protein